jgi:hypothetical protein
MGGIYNLKISHTHTHACACLFWSVSQSITSHGCKEWLQLANKFRNVNVSISGFKVNFPQYLLLRLSTAVKCTASFSSGISKIQIAAQTLCPGSSCLSSVPSHKYLDSISNYGTPASFDTVFDLLVFKYLSFNSVKLHWCDHPINYK